MLLICTDRKLAFKKKLLSGSGCFSLLESTTQKQTKHTLKSKSKNQTKHTLSSQCRVAVYHTRIQKKNYIWQERFFSRRNFLSPGDTVCVLKSTPSWKNRRLKICYELYHPGIRKTEMSSTFALFARMLLFTPASESHQTGKTVILVGWQCQESAIQEICDV